ncbi:MAG: VanZ family protein [Chloroflexi bacterium]|nr:VanZ family protein [Chloroflexota bacterium]
MLGRVARIVWIWLPPLVWMAAILWMSGRSDLPVRTNPQTGETIKTTFTLAKLAHVFEYSVLALLLLRAGLSRAGGLGLRLVPAIVATVAWAGLFGGLDELWQSLTPNREPRLTDVALDTASALAACLAVALWRRSRADKIPHPSPRSVGLRREAAP